MLPPQSLCFLSSPPGPAGLRKAPRSHHSCRKRWEERERCSPYQLPPRSVPILMQSSQQLPVCLEPRDWRNRVGGGPRKDCSEAPFPEEEIAEPRAFCPVLHPSPPPTASAFAPSSQRHLRTLNQFCFSPCLFPVPQTKDYRCSGEPEV